MKQNLSSVVLPNSTKEKVNYYSATSGLNKSQSYQFLINLGFYVVENLKDAKHLILTDRDQEIIYQNSIEEGIEYKKQFKIKNNQIN